MATLTNSEGRVLTYKVVETILLQLNSSNNYYTTGEHDIISIKAGSNKLLLLDHTYHINRNIFHMYTIIENIINSYNLESILNANSNEYDLQSVYNGNGFIGLLSDLPQIALAIYDTNIQPFTYTGSESLGTTNNQVSLKPPIKITDEIVLHPRAYGIQFEMHAGTSGLVFYKTLMMEDKP